MLNFELNLDYNWGNFVLGSLMALGLFFFAFFMPYKRRYVKDELLYVGLIGQAVSCLVFLVFVIFYGLSDGYSSGFFAGYIVTLIAALVAYVSVKFIAPARKYKKAPKGMSNVMNLTSGEDSDEFTTQNFYWITVVVYSLCSFFFVLYAFGFYSNHMITYRDAENKLIISEFDSQVKGTKIDDKVIVLFFEKERVAVKEFTVAKGFNDNKISAQTIARNPALPFKYISFKEAEEFLKKK